MPEHDCTTVTGRQLAGAEALIDILRRGAEAECPPIPWTVGPDTVLGTLTAHGGDDRQLVREFDSWRAALGDTQIPQRSADRNGNWSLFAHIHPARPGVCIVLHAEFHVNAG